MDRQIVCVAIPSFEVALARLNDPLLRTRPLAIAPINTSRARCVKSPSKRCRTVSPWGCPSNRPSDCALHCTCLNVVTRYAPVWEPFHAGSFVTDLTGTTRLFGSACDVAAKVQQDILKQYRLDGVAGVGIEEDSKKGYTVTGQGSYLPLIPGPLASPFVVSPRRFEPVLLP